MVASYRLFFFSPLTLSTSVLIKFTVSPVVKWDNSTVFTLNILLYTHDIIPETADIHTILQYIQYRNYTTR